MHMIKELQFVMQLQIQLLQHQHAEPQHMDKAWEQTGSPNTDEMEEGGETHAAGISHFGPIMESHYQSQSCPGRPNEAPHGEGWPPHAETRQGGRSEARQLN